MKRSRDTLKPIWSVSSAVALLPTSPTPAGVYCPWMSREEWETVYSWLYSERCELRKKGVGRVAAWKARTQIPLAVEMTADLVECRLAERENSSVFQSLILSYSMAISRFVNGVNELVKMKLRDDQSNIASNVQLYGVPSWLVGLRHSSTHELLPSLSALRTGVEFSLSWLRSNYWEPQHLLIGEHYDTPSSFSCTAVPEGVVTVVGGGGEEGGGGGGVVWRLTRGLCRTRLDLLQLLTNSSTSDLIDYLKRKQLLQFPPNVKYTVQAPDASDLASFPELSVSSGDMAMWRTHLLKAASKDSSFKQRLVSAIVTVINESGCCVELRDYLGGWLGKLLIEHYEVEVDQSHDGSAEIVHIVDDGDQFLPGGQLDWKVLLNTARDQPGYYSYAVILVILQHLQSLLTAPVREKVLYLTKLVTLSSRVGSSSFIPGSRRGQYQREFEETKVALEKKGGDASSEAPAATTQEEEGCHHCHQRWVAVREMSEWVDIPLGLYPGQKLTSTMFDVLTTDHENTRSPQQQCENEHQPMNVELTYNRTQIASQVTLY